MPVQNIQKFFLERSVLNAQMTAGHFWMIPFIELCIDIPKVDGAVLINELVRPHLEFVIECTDRTAIDLPWTADEQLPDFKVQRPQRKRPFRLRKCLLYIAMRQRVRAAEDSGRLRMRMSCLVRIRQAEIFVIKFLPFPFREKACKLFCHLLPRFCLSA